MSSSDNWHVVFSAPRWELRAGRALDLLPGVRAFCPARRVERLFRGARRSVELALLPRIVFAWWDERDPHLWHDVANTERVSSILGGEFPASLLGADAALIDGWLARADHAWVVPGLEPIVLALSSGDLARISDPDGLYDGITGRVLWLNAENVCLQMERNRLQVPAQLVERVENVDSSTMGSAATRSAKKRLRRHRSYLRRQAFDRIERRENALR